MTLERYTENTSQIKRFRHWLRERGFSKHQPLAFGEFTESGRGLAATSPIHADEIIVTVPEKAIITAKIAHTTYSWTKSISQQASIAVYLALEKIKGDASEWTPYLTVLPSSFETMPIQYPKELLKYLPRDILDRRQHQLQTLEHDWSQVLSLIPPDFGLQIPYETFKWAWLIVHTRGITLNGNTNETSYLKRVPIIGIAPYLDCLNHHPHARIQVKYDTSRKELVLIAKEPSTHSDQQDVPKKNRILFDRGEEVFIHYGPHDNHFLLAEYGFCANRGTNSWNQVVLDDQVRLLLQQYRTSSSYTKPGSHRYVDEAMDILEKEGWTGDMALTLEDPRPFRLLQCLRLVSCGGKADTLNSQVPVSIQKWGAEDEKVPGAALWKAHLASWRKVNVGALDRMDFDIDKDVGKICGQLYKNVYSDRKMKRAKLEALSKDEWGYAYNFVLQILEEDMEILNHAIHHLAVPILREE